MQSSLKTVVFIDSVHNALWNSLQGMGFNCEDHTESGREEIMSATKEAIGIVIRSKFRIDKTFMDQAPHLKFIARSGAGLENIDMDYAKERSITIYNSPEGNRTAVAEHALGMLLSLFNNINRSNQEVREGIWKREENRGVELAGKTVGIIGYGNMGSAFAEVLKGLSCEVLAYDKYRSSFGNTIVREVDLTTIFEKTDVLSIHVPYNQETHYLINDSFIHQFKKDIYIINTARGKCLNTTDLVKNLKSGKVKGACLDVLEYEKSSFENMDFTQLPPPFQYIIEASNIVLTPHVAGWTKESYKKLSTVLADKINVGLTDLNFN